MDMQNKGGWLQSTKSFFSSLVVPLPDNNQQQQQQQQQQQNQNGYGYSQTQQTGAGYSAQPYQPATHQQYYQQQQQQMQQQPQQANYMNQFDNQLNRELNNGGYGGSNVNSPSNRASGGYGHIDSSWNDGSAEGLAPAVPLAQQYGAAPSSRGSSRRNSADHTNNPVFPTSAFPTSPPSALSEQLQPLNHPNYTPNSLHRNNAAQPHTMQQAGAVHNISEFQGVTAVSGSPPPAFPQQSSQPTSAPSFAPPPNPLLPPTTYPLQPSSNNTSPQHATQPPVFNPAAPHNAAPPARRVLDENSINPTLSSPQPNPAYAGYQPPAANGYGAPSSAPGSLASPGRVLSPAFNTGDGGYGQTVPSGNVLRASIPAPISNQPIASPAAALYASAPSSQPAPAPGMGAAPATGSGLMPPPPPVSNYWKQRAAVAGPEKVENTLGRVDYSDLDYKSMDFAYNNRYEQQQQQAAFTHPAMQAPSQQHLQQQPPQGYPAPGAPQPGYMSSPQQPQPYPNQNYNPYGPR